MCKQVMYYVYIGYTGFYNCVIITGMQEQTSATSKVVYGKPATVRQMRPPIKIRGFIFVHLLFGPYYLYVIY